MKKIEKMSLRRIMNKSLIGKSENKTGGVRNKTSMRITIIITIIAEVSLVIPK